MNIRALLTLRFIVITAIIIMMGSSLIYIFSADYRKDDFYSRLQNKANNTATLLIEVDEIDVNLLRKIEQDNPVSLPNERIVIYDYKDSLLFSTDEKKEITISADILDQIRLEEEVRFSQGNFEVLGFLFKGKYERFVVVAAATDIYGFKRLSNLIYILIIVFAISMVIISISGWFFAGKALEPIAQIIAEVADISINSLNKRVNEGNGKDEIARLAQTFNKMLSRLEKSFYAQKSFISNASHELRTPLTAITGQLEVTLLNQRSNDDYKSVISSVLEDIKTLNRLSNRLLMLAQTTSEAKEKKFSYIRIDELIWQAKEELLKYRPDFIINIDIQEDMDDETLTISGDEQLIKTAFTNLIENACKYSENHTAKIFIRTTGSRLTVDIEDNGIGIPESDMANIFEPFYRGSNTISTKGHGIGLSMVKGILNLHNASLKLDSKLGKGTLITLFFSVIKHKEN